MNYALITGASDGIGYQLALRFAGNGDNLILVARQESKLKQIGQYLENTYKIQAFAIPMDLCNPNAANEIYRKVRERSIIVTYLINNAGFYVKGSFSGTSWEDELKLIQIQCLTHTHLTKLFLQEMLRQGKGRILNVGSTGSFVPGPYNAVYCAAKSFVLSFSEALAEELSGTGVTVTALCPGGTKTDFWRGTKRKSSFLSPLMEASTVAEKGYEALMKGQRIAVPGSVNKINVFISRFIPRNLMTRLAGRFAKYY